MAGRIHVAKLESRTTGSLDFFEHRAHKKTEPLVVGRPERARGAFRASERLRRDGIELADPNKTFTVKRGGDERQAPAIGRNDDRTWIFAGEIKPCVLWRWNESTNGRRLNRRLSEVTDD